MKPYEVVVILDGESDDQIVEATINKIKETVVAQKGKIGQIEKWGKRKLAYEIKHRKEGNYSLIEFNADPSSIAEIDRVIRLSDNVLRHKVVCLPEFVAGRKRPSLKIAEEKEKTEKREESLRSNEKE